MSSAAPVTEPPDESMTMSAYARYRGVAPHTVHSAVYTGKLKLSVDWSGKHPRIVSAELADREWQLTAPPDEAKKRELSQKLDGIPTLAESRARLQATKVKIAEMQLAERQKQLVPIDGIRNEIKSRFAAIRTRLLAIPTEARQRIQKLDDADALLLDDLVREALEQLADDFA